MVNLFNNKEKIQSPRIIILSSPSGAGKTTIARQLQKRNSNMVISISVTTRIRNEAEKDGVDYFFISKEEFSNQIQDDKYLEYAEIYGNYYGTLRDSVYKTLQNGKDLIFDIDWQGHRSIKEKIHDVDILSFFIMPPSIEVLEERLRKRNREGDTIISDRLKQANNEMSHRNEYDYIIVNDDLERAVEEIEKIINQYTTKT
jgi:guanylate kinase